MWDKFDQLASVLLGAPKRQDRARSHVKLPRLSDWLPYRMYDPKTALYYNRNSVGFIVEAAPMCGSDQSVQDSLIKFLADSMPDGSHMQVLCHSSPRIAHKLRDWHRSRFATGGLYRRIADQRLKRMFDGVWNSLSEEAPFQLRNFRIVLSIGVSGSGQNKRKLEELIALRNGLRGLLKTTAQVETVDLKPGQLIALIDDLTSPTTAASDTEVDYNPHVPIADQAIRRDMAYKIEPNRIILANERFRPTGVIENGIAEVGEIFPDKFEARHFGVSRFPTHWAGGEMARLIGDFSR